MTADARSIVHVDHGAALGGAERSLIELARAQQARGRRVAVACGRTDRLATALAVAGLRCIDLRWPAELVTAPISSGTLALLRGLPAALRSAQRLRHAVRRERPAMVHVHTRKAQLVSALLPLGDGTRMVWHLRDDVPASRALRLVTRLAMRRVDHAVALTTWMADHYAGKGIRPRSGRIGLVPSSVDPIGLRGLPTPFLDGAEQVVVGFVGQVARWKAPHLLIEAAEDMRDLPQVSFRIVGEVLFSRAEAGYSRWLVERLAGSPAADRIERIGLAASPADAFRGVDVLVHTSTSPEPFGRVLVEAMVARRPIVALRHGSPVELLDESCAVFAERPDGRSIAAAIRTVVTDRERARALADAAVERASGYEPDVVAAAMDAEYARA